jgi:hypothetical protein
MGTETLLARPTAFELANGQDDQNLAEFPIFWITKPEDANGFTLSF